MPDILEGTELFMRSAAQSTDGGLFHDDATRALRMALLTEEVEEWATAENADDLVEVVDGLLDIIVVAHGTLLSYIGKDAATECAAEVTRSNLDKIGPNGEVVKDANGKTRKREGWTRPDIAGTLAKYGYTVNA
jgi:predicted HAD superfamily Cof-like phosphohydrolase